MVMGYGSTIMVNYGKQFGKPWLTTVDHMDEPYQNMVQKPWFNNGVWVWFNHMVDIG